MDKKIPRGRVGRPRANPRPIEQPPEEEILAVAGRLFAQKGFAGTSTREIAEGAGLRQPSLFHYYPKKERILEALLDRLAAALVRTTASLSATPAPAPVALYRLVHGNVLGLTEASEPAAAIVFLPEVQPPNFPAFWEAHDEQLRFARDMIARGVESGDFDCADPVLVANSLAGMTHGVLTWLHRTDQLGPTQVATAVADLQLRSLLKDPAQLPTIRGLATSLPLRGTTGHA